MKKIAIVSGYFNPLHVGHISLFKEAKKLGDKLFVIVNNDIQVRVKKSIPFMKESERKKIIEAIRYVDRVIISIDKDSSVCKTLERISKSNKDLIFVNGGDKKKDNIPENKICERLGIKTVYNVGEEKKQSSSLLIKNIIKYKE